MSGNSGELAHKPLLKQAQQSNNRKQIAEGITTFNARRASLLMLDAQERSLEGEGDDEDCEDTDADYADDAEKETYSCVVFVKYPLLESTFDRSAQHRRIEAPGRRGEGRQRINLNTCRFDQALTRDCLTNFLDFLPVQLGQYAYDYLWRELGLRETPEAARTVGQLNAIRQHYIAQGKKGAHALTFGGIAIESDRMAGIVRVRARPFRSDPFHGRNPQDAVMMVPGLDVYQGDPAKFDTRNPEHLDMISYGNLLYKIMLLLNIII